MTDFSTSLKTHTAPIIDPIVGLGSAPSSTKGVHLPGSNGLPVNEEEDYTIKCICGFKDDDGSTVFCERCETWQHIECYYFDEGTVPDVSNIDHSCAECEPRQLDAQGAADRQSKRREEFDPRRVKKMTTKSHKKKVKASETTPTLSNGWSNDRNDHHDHTSRSPRDLLPPAKKIKTSHRSSGSMNFPSTSVHAQGQKALGPSSRYMHSPTGAPSTNPLERDVSEAYSPAFLNLYVDDPGDAPMQANLFNDITITSSLSSWSHDVESLREATNGLSPQEVFLRCDQPLDTMTLPHLRKEHKQEMPVEVDGRHPTWKFLTIDCLTPKDSIVGELRGKIGHMQDYVQDPTNQWDYLRHPVPFVFFHEKLPIYIDTRREGTITRYLRRSCSPNLSMKTILENGSDYHFCFVAKHDIEAGTELTIAWVLDEHIRNFFYNRGSDEPKQEGNVDAENYVTDWVGKVLAQFGQCACNIPNQCALARYDRRNGRTSNSSRHLANGKPVKGRNGYVNRPSPPSTNSRADSEVAKHPDEEELEDGRSTSGSMRSKARSRDVTPAGRTFGDTESAPGVPLSDREKRKIAALEKNFEQLEQDRQPASKKKKRNSGGSSLSTPSATTFKQLGHGVTCLSQPNTPGVSSKPSPLDMNIPRRRSVSPTAKSQRNLANSRNASTGKKVIPSTAPAGPYLARPNYVDSATQTDAVCYADWHEQAIPPQSARKPYMSLTKRLLLRCQRDRQRLESRKNYESDTLNETESVTQTPVAENICEPSVLDSVNGAQSVILEDSEMHDVENEVSEPQQISPDPPAPKPRPPDPLAPDFSHVSISEIKLPPPPWPAPGAQPAAEPSGLTNGHRFHDLRVQLPSTTQNFIDSPLDPSLVVTPTSMPARSLSNQTPAVVSAPPSAKSFSLVQPSPIKKKLSLGQYMENLKNNKADSLPTPEPITSGSPARVPLPSPIREMLSLDNELGLSGGNSIVAIPKEDKEGLGARRGSNS